MHRNVFRGKDLGSVVTAAQKATIASGMFEDIYVGDYWTINGIKWRIVDFNSWYKKGKTRYITEQHVVVMPDTVLFNGQMNLSQQTTGAYRGSNVYINLRATMRTQVTNAFGSNLLLVSQLLANSVDSKGYPVGAAWSDEDVNIPSATMIFGTSAFAPTASGDVQPPWNHTETPGQLALFRLAPDYIRGEGNKSYWLRDVLSAAHFSVVGDGIDQGIVDRALVQANLGIRPVFAIR